MSNRMPSPSVIRIWVPGLLLAAALLAALAAPPPARAQATTPPAQEREPLEPDVDESFAIRLDEDLFQLEETVSLIARSLNKVADRTPSLAINSFYFGRNIDSDFRRKAEVIILDKVFKVNPNVRLVQCQECQKLETKIVHGVIKLRKGIPSQESRRALAEKLGVDGFIDIGMFRDNGQMTVYIKVVEAESGAIIMVDELAGRRAAMRSALTVSFGEIVFPLVSNGTSVDHKALTLGVQEAVKLTGRFSFAVDLILYLDNNQNNPDATLSLDAGLLLSPTLGFDVLQIPSSTSRLVLFLGIGKLISPQLDYANFVRTGVDLIVGDNLSVVFGFNSYLEANVESTTTTITLEGSGYEIRFGYRF